MQPENYAEAPSLITLVTTPPSDQAFWKEAGKTLAWVRYVWVGPTPNVTMDLNNVYAARQFSAQAIYAGIRFLAVSSGCRINWLKGAEGGASWPMWHARVEPERI